MRQASHRANVFSSELAQIENPPSTGLKRRKIAEKYVQGGDDVCRIIPGFQLQMYLLIFSGGVDIYGSAMLFLRPSYIYFGCGGGECERL